MQKRGVRITKLLQPSRDQEWEADGTHCSWGVAPQTKQVWSCRGALRKLGAMYSFGEEHGDDARSFWAAPAPQNRSPSKTLARTPVAMRRRRPIIDWWGQKEMLAAQFKKYTEQDASSTEAESRRMCRAIHGLGHHLGKALRDLPQPITDASRREALTSVSYDPFDNALKAGADINWGDPATNGLTVLHSAAANNDLRLLQFLLHRRADPAALDWSNRSALHLAAKEGHVRVAQELLERMDKDAVNWLDEHHATPLHLAAMYDHVPVARLLVARDADPAEEDELSHRPLDLAVKAGAHGVARFLANHHPDAPPENSELLDEFDRECNIHRRQEILMKIASSLGKKGRRGRRKRK